MPTKPLVQSIDVLLSTVDDTATINRLLVAAAISPRFRASLLADPVSAIQAGFNGELFPLSASTHQIFSSIKAHSLQDFVLQLNEMSAYRLL